MRRENGRPEGANWLTPYLTVADADASLAFYQRAFGFEPNGSMRGSDGRTVHASMNYQGAAIVMFSPEGAMGDTTMRTPAHGCADLPVNLYVYCPDVDALTARARAAGAKVVHEPEDMFWGDRMASLRDTDGYTWSFATNVGDFDPSKAPKM
jgi:uncharacterized glyoxalase superfamily protein PhnB